MPEHSLQGVLELRYGNRRFGHGKVTSKRRVSGGPVHRSHFIPCINATLAPKILESVRRNHHFCVPERPIYDRMIHDDKAAESRTSRGISRGYIPSISSLSHACLPEVASHLPLILILLLHLLVAVTRIFPATVILILVLVLVLIALVGRRLAQLISYRGEKLLGMFPQGLILVVL